MSPTVLPAAKRESGLKGRHVLGAMVAFFGTIFAVNGVLLYKAIATHSGLVAQEPYRKGLHYNDRIAADERQRALGWEDAVTLMPGGKVVVKMTDLGGGPVTQLTLSGFIGRPSTTQHDLRVALSETAPGQYSAEMGALETGAWLLSLEARRADAGTAMAGRDALGEPVYRLKRRLWLKP